MRIHDDHNSQFRKFNSLPQNLSPAPGINDLSVKEILRVLQLHTSIGLLDFVDDLLGSAETEYLAWAKIEAALDLFAAAGLRISLKVGGVKVPPRVQE